MKRYLGLLVLTLAACSTQTPQPTITHRSPSLPQPSKTVVKIKQQPEDYVVWIATADHRQSVQAYKQFLKQKGLADLVPDHELLRSARDWQNVELSLTQCHHARFGPTLFRRSIY